jgi:hypothetical protein
MCVRPSPHNARRPSSGKPGPNRFHQVHLCKTEDTETVREFQAAKLRRLYYFCHATARTVASLVFAGGPR